MKQYSLTILCLLFLGLAQTPAQTAATTTPPTSVELLEAGQLNIKVTQLYRSGKFAEALPLAQRAVQLVDKAPDANLNSQAAARINLAEVYVSKKDYVQAAPLYQEILTRYEKNGKVEAVKHIFALDRLSAIYFALKDYKRADKFAEQSLAWREKTFGVDGPELIDNLAALAQAQLAQNNYGTAARLFDRARVISEKHNGPEHLITARLLESAARTEYFDGGNLKKVEEYYRRALAVKRKLLGENNFEVKLTLLRLANFYRYQQKPQDAEPLFLRAIAAEDNLPELAEEDSSNSAVTLYTCFLTETKQNIKLKFFREERAAKQGQPYEAAEGEVLNGRAVKLPKPEYPASAKASRISGTVSILVTIDETGKVIKARGLCGGFPPLVEASIAAAYGARFTPTLLNGKPVKVTGVINYNYVAQ